VHELRAGELFEQVGLDRLQPSPFAVCPRVVDVGEWFLARQRDQSLEIVDFDQLSGAQVVELVDVGAQAVAVDRVAVRAANECITEYALGLSFCLPESLARLARWVAGPERFHEFVHGCRRALQDEVGDQAARRMFAQALSISIADA
jgi:hypothetical protein